eukprot:CAMPEP_0197659046 /NCGR_PEP_ID=MMETSP1338-20131121/46008_1 /TAXON_ID=43686 ORGANISM="Pelagodinium beii, Strain RCC1491" /NCGR_SAMPLE_ID=MMETSP1338 /ASSEMBLY_ACC=CAM_ASM_000754 /LENGTH=119 /DNA_ID=CAMNT_0043235791 /DNA_START=59 /DNA_END=414 /DNA_ORIENTATION=+
MAPKKGIKARKAMKARTMKAMKSGKAVMTKTGLADALATEHDMKRSQVAKVLDTLATVGAKEVKSAGKFTIPGLCMIKTRRKPATKAGERLMFGKTVAVKAQPAKTVVKAFCVAALKKT